MTAPVGCRSRAHEFSHRNVIFTRQVISVLLPTLDQRPRLGAAIESVLDQGYDDLELVIADDGSRGETRATIDRRRADSRVRVVENSGPKRTITENWNAALEASSGDYVLLLGDDDVLLPGSLRRMDELTQGSDAPDCLSFHGYRFAAAGSVAGIDEGRYEALELAPELRPPGGELSPETRRTIVREFFGFHHHLPLGVMALVLAARPAIERLPNGLFRPPFPDFYAVAALLLSARSWRHAGDDVVVVGISPSSVAGQFHRGRQEEALAYLGEQEDFPGALPGNPFVNATCRWLTELREDFPGELGDLEIDRGQYLARQVWAGYRQHSVGAIDRRELLRRLRLLSIRDLAALARASLRPRNLRYVASAFRRRRGLEREMLIRSTQPTSAGSIEEFVASLHSR